MVPQPAPAQQPPDPRHRLLQRRRFQDSLRQLQVLCSRLVEEYEWDAADLTFQQKSLACEPGSPIPPTLDHAISGDLNGGSVVPRSNSLPDVAVGRCMRSATEEGQHEASGIGDFEFENEQSPREQPTRGQPTQRRHISAILRQSSNVLTEANAMASSANLGGQQPSFAGSVLVTAAQKLVIHPSSRWCTIWDVLGGLLISYDVVMIPMEYFPLSRHGFIASMSLIVVLYWTIDVVVRFFFGYFDEGVAETVFHKVARNYLKGWFVPDFVVVFMDWLFMALGEMSQATRSWRISRAVRALRILRLVRLIRLLKFWRMLGQATDCLKSQMWLVAAKGAYLCMTVLLSAHYIACYWYAVGIWEPIPVTSWVQAQDLESADAGTLYVFSMHWCIAQSGFGDVQTHSTNILEHVYSIFAQLSWIALVSGTLCCCTNWLMEVREASCDLTKQEAMLRKFLLRRKSSAQLVSRIVCFFRAYHKRRDNIVTESEVEVLPSLPLLLGIRLHREMYLAYLKVHPAFDRFAHESKIGILSVCHLAMSEVFVDTGQEVFTEAEQAHHMLIVASGFLQYYLAQCKQAKKVSPGSCLSEACLWLPGWLHLGSLVSSTPSELVALNAEKLQAVISECEQAGGSDLAIRTYGRLFAEMAAGDVKSDLCEDMTCIFDIAREAFVQEGRGVDETGSTKTRGFMALLVQRLGTTDLRTASSNLSRTFTARTISSHNSRRIA